MRKDYLALLAAKLDTVPGGRYTQDAFVCSAYGVTGPRALDALGQTPLRWLIEHDCGTSACACALGYATTIPELQAAGLRWLGMTPTFGVYYGLAAAAELFEINLDTTISIFGSHPEHNGTPKGTAEYIRKVIAEGYAEGD